FRVLGNEQLIEISRRKPESREAIASIKGVPKGILEAQSSRILEAIRRGLAVPETALPRFPKAPRWERDPDFDTRVAALKTVRDAVATELDLDPGVLCARDRLEAVARKSPASLDDLRGVTELRAWQVAVLGEGFLRALKGARA